MDTTRIKLGDKVSALYGETTVVGVISMFDYSGHIHIDLTQPADLGFRVETESLCIAPFNRGTVKVLVAGPELTAEDVGEVSGCGVVFLRSKVAA